MARRFFENASNAGMNPTPNDMYRSLMQNFIDSEWVNSSAKTPELGGVVLEQNGIGSDEYTEIEAWIETPVIDVTSGLRDAGDYLKLLFRSIEHTSTRGMMYQFGGNYWIVTNFNPYSGLPQSVGVRRCNNELKIVDPMTAEIKTFPCVVEYDAASPSEGVSRYIITPNNHLVVIVQGNDDTWRLMKINTRYVIGGRVFRLTAYQNALRNAETGDPNLLYLDMYLDEVNDKDDIENGLANNDGVQVKYTVVITDGNINLNKGASKQLTAVVYYNGEVVERELEWASDDPAVTVADGLVTAVGDIGEGAFITAKIKDRSEYGIIGVTISTATDAEFSITPMFNKIRQFETIKFTVSPSGATVTADDEVTLVDATEPDTYYITGEKICQEAKIIITKDDETKTFGVKVTSMLGG